MRTSERVDCGCVYIVAHIICMYITYKHIIYIHTVYAKVDVYAYVFICVCDNIGKHFYGTF